MKWPFVLGLLAAGGFLLYARGVCIRGSLPWLPEGTPQKWKELCLFDSWKRASLEDFKRREASGEISVTA